MGTPFFVLYGCQLKKLMAKEVEAKAGLFKEKGWVRNE
jgi:hypothetical protein